MLPLNMVNGRCDKVTLPLMLQPKFEQLDMLPKTFWVISSIEPTSFNAAIRKSCHLRMTKEFYEQALSDTELLMNEEAGCVVGIDVWNWYVYNAVSLVITDRDQWDRIRNDVLNASSRVSLMKDLGMIPAHETRVHHGGEQGSPCKRTPAGAVPRRLTNPRDCDTHVKDFFPTAPPNSDCSDVGDYRNI